MDVNALIRELEQFKRIAADMQIATALTFLYVGRRGVCVQKDIELELGLSNAAASRNVNWWTRTGKQELDYIERYEDTTDRRNNMLRLTKQGLQFYKALTNPPWEKSNGTA